MFSDVLQNALLGYFGNHNFIPVLSKEWVVLPVTLIITYMAMLSWDWLIAHIICLRLSMKNYEVTKTQWKSTIQNWALQGNLYWTENGLALTDSPAGSLLISKWYQPFTNKWKDFKCEVSFSFPNMKQVDTNLIGCSDSRLWKVVTSEMRPIMSLIFRAQSLDDYYMVSIWKVENKLFLKPHIKVDGIWILPHYISPQSLSLKKDKHDEIKVEIKVVGNLVKITELYSKESLNWFLPSEYVISDNRVNLKSGFIQKIPFANKAGRIGLRNAGDEFALVHSLRVYKYVKENKSELSSAS